MSPSVAELFDRRLQARSLAYLLTIGAITGALVLVFPHSPSVDDGPLVGIVAAALAVAALLLWRAPRVGAAEIHAGLALGTLLIAGANFVVEGTVLFPLLFTWTGLFAFYFLRIRQALAHIALIGAAFALVLALTDQPSPFVRWLLAVGTPLVAGLPIARLLGGVRAQAAAAAESERVLRESEQRTRAIVESAPEAFVTLDREGTVLMWNPAAERMLGWDAHEALGRRVRDLIIRDEDREGHLARLERDFDVAERERRPDTREVILQRRDGTPIPAELTIARVRAGDQDVVTTFIRDLSDRERREVERGELVREQAARAEAERMASIVHGLQLLLDAALANNRIEDMLTALVPRLTEVLDAEAASIMLVEEDGRLAVRASTGPSLPEETFAPGEGVAGQVLERREPVLLQDPDPARLGDPALQGMGSVLAAPLAGEEVAGVVLVGVPAPRRFGDDDLLLLGLAADRVGLAIEHARVYEREHRIAETLQRSLLPERLPHLAGLRAAARYLPAAAEAEVGGDWYDVIPMVGGRVALVMGDVAGKGLAAASMVGRLRSAMRAYTLEGHDAAGVVERLNELVLSEGDEASQMVTLVYVIVDPPAGTLCWVNAGHLPPLLAAGGETRLLETDASVPLGVMPFATYAVADTKLPPGATLVLYTDGLVERPGEVLDAGLGRLATAIASGPPGPEELCEHVVRRLVPVGGAADDVALLALHDPPLTDSFRIDLPARPGELGAMRAMLRRWLERAEGTETEVGEILTATGEATANAIEHADSGIEAPIEISGALHDGSVEITVRDHGTWRPGRDDGGGRGLVLMHALMDSVEVTAAPDGTTVAMTRTLGGPQNGAG